MIADSSVYNLWVGLTDRWRSDYVADMGGGTLPAFLASGATPQQRNAAYLDKVRALVAERGIVRTLAAQLGRQYFRLFSAKTPLVSQLPGPACAGHLSIYTSPPWLTRVLTVVNDLFHGLLLVAGALGIACWRREGPADSVRAGNTIPTQTLPPSTGLRTGLKGTASTHALLVLIALFFAYQLALLLLIHVKARFLLPMIPFLCGFGGSFRRAARRVFSLAAGDGKRRYSTIDGFWPVTQYRADPDSPRGRRAARRALAVPRVCGPRARSSVRAIGAAESGILRIPCRFFRRACPSV